MQQKSIKKNYLYNLVYQVLLLITPLITTPYLSRVLGADGIGTVSFAESIVSYFTLIASLGIATYGQREISYVRDDRNQRSLVFWETKILQAIISGVVFVAYILFAILQHNSLLYLVLSFNILAVLVDVVWLFQGLEEFGKIVGRNIVFKAISIVFVFAAVKTKDDIVIYALSLALFLFLSNVALWFSIFKYIDKPAWKNIQPFKNFKAVLSLFIPTIAIQVYTVLDKTMIGIITGSAFENGYYEQAVKISKMVLTVVTALGTVMIPRIGYYFGKGDNETVKVYMYRAYRFVWFLGIPLYFGLLAVSPNFIPWFLGNGFDEVIPLLGILGFLILAIGINNVTGVLYLIPTKRQNTFTLTVIIGASVNFVLNAILIQIMQSIGAAIASVIAETVIAILQLWIVRKELSSKRIFLSGWRYYLAGGIMFVLVRIVESKLTLSIVNTLILTSLGGVIYVISLLIMRDDFFVENVKLIVGRFIGKKHGDKDV